jgi:hypothetical protein
MSGIHYVTEPDGYLEPKLTSTGFGARPPVTVIDVQDTAVMIMIKKILN